jgi:hypothetical protein
MPVGLLSETGEVPVLQQKPPLPQYLAGLSS